LKKLKFELFKRYLKGEDFDRQLEIQPPEGGERFRLPPANGSRSGWKKII
jgi:hypothetical protein